MQGLVFEEVFAALGALQLDTGEVARLRGINREHECLLVARDRGRQTLDFDTGRGPVSAARLKDCLGPVLAAGVLLISDSAAAYGVFARETGIAHETVNLRAGIRARGAIHLNNVNGWHARFKNWLKRFNGPVRQLSSEKERMNAHGAKKKARASAGSKPPGEEIRLRTCSAGRTGTRGQSHCSPPRCRAGG